MRNLRDDIKDIKDNTQKRIETLESYKFDKVEAQRLMLEGQKVHDDHESRIRLMESRYENLIGKWGVVVAIAITAISALISWLFNKI